MAGANSQFQVAQLDFNDIALHIATNTNRTPLERMEGLLTEKTYRR